MASNTDFQKIFDRYRKEGLPLGVSIVDFCLANGVVYKQYERWLKNRRKVAIHPVSLTNVPKEVEHEEEVLETPTDDLAEPVSVEPLSSSPVLFNLRIVTSSGMMLQHRNLDYAKLLNLVQRLEGIC